MLNLSDNRVDDQQYLGKYDSLDAVEQVGKPLRKLRTIGYIMVALLGFLFLPWTQNIRAPGELTTLFPSQRPQTVQSVIPGRIEKWYVREGQFVNAGDTIIRISEVKDAYFDPNLIPNTELQIGAKKQSALNYAQKADALNAQIDALEKVRSNKLEQAQNKLAQARLKVESDSIALQAALVDLDITRQRLQRMEELYKQGLKSLTDLESRRLNLQKAQADKVAAENRLLAARNELLIARIELDAVENEYTEKIAKARSDLNTAQSSYFEANVEIAKLDNQLANYRVRQANYYITAPQDGYVTKAISVGIGETIKEGTEIVSVMPEYYDFAAELYIEPVDFPLLRKGDPVRLIFDGWPAIVFSGWPELSNGTFPGRVLAIDNFISPNGKYRILVVPSEAGQAWPQELRVGSGAEGILLLKDVPLWYELWRQLNGFPPDFYRSSTAGVAPKETSQ